MVCNKCGFQISGESNFCPNCGTEIEIKVETKEIINLNSPFWFADLSPEQFAQISNGDFGICVKYMNEADICMRKYRGEKAFKKANIYLSKAIEVFPLLLDNYWKRGFNHSVLSNLHPFFYRDLDVIIHDMTTIINTDPYLGVKCEPISLSGGPYYFRGRVYARRKEHKQDAINDLEKALELGIGLNRAFTSTLLVDDAPVDITEEGATKLDLDMLKHGTGSMLKSLFKKDY